MTPEEQAAEARIQYIAQQQGLLAQAVEAMQGKLANEIVARIEKIAANPAELGAVFRAFEAGPYKKVVGQFVNDILTVGRKNAEYFTAVLGEFDLPKDYYTTKLTIQDSLRQRFGITSTGAMVPDGFIDLFVKDTTVQQAAKKYAYNAQVSGVGLQEFKKGLRTIIEGDSTRGGGYAKHFNQYAYDTYQQADALVQEQYAEQLGLQAALYAGGEIAGTRPFCRARVGKVFTREEVEEWSALTFAGKTPNYNPFIDRGGYNCRHHLNYLTNKQAARRREDLEIGPDGKLRKKKGAEPQEVDEVSTAAPAATNPAPVPTAPKTVKRAAYKNDREFEAACGAGGWDVDQLNVSAVRFNEVLSGMDIEKLGTATRQQFEAAGLRIDEMTLKKASSGIMTRIEGIDQRGNRFTMVRGFEVGSDGARSVSHELLVLPEKLQGGGFTKELFGTWYEGYKQAGIQQVEVHANINVGGYAWAKYGFAANDLGTVERVFMRAERVLDRLIDYGGTVKGKDASEFWDVDQLSKAIRAGRETMYDFYKTNPDTTPFPMHLISDLKDGKSVLLNNDWYGKIDLTNADSVKRWEAYLYSK